MRHQAGHVTEVQFPESMTLSDGSVLPLTYRFEPTHVLDGVTVCAVAIAQPVGCQSTGLPGSRFDS